MKNKTLWKQVGAAAIAAAMVMSTVPATPVQAAGGKTLAVSSQKQLNQALKTVKGKNAVITVKAGKNVKITIPKGTYKVTIRVVGKKAAVVNNGTVKEIVVNSKGTVAIKNNGTIKKVTVQNAKRVSFSGNCKKAGKCRRRFDDSGSTGENNRKERCEHCAQKRCGEIIHNVYKKCTGTGG